MPRTLGSITEAILSANEYEEYDFIKIVFPSPVGTLRFTNRPNGYIGNIDGTSQTWVEVDYIHGPISQANQNILVVTWIRFANIDYTWTNYAYQYGIRGREATLYTGVWNPATGLFVNSYISYNGTLDEGEFNEYAKITVKPHHTPWHYLIPRGRMEGRCINTYRDLMDCQYTGAEPVGQLTCGYTRFDCRARGNEININIYDDMPKPDEKMMYGGIRHGLAPAPNLGE
jgi:hypothetical protein